MQELFIAAAAIFSAIVGLWSVKVYMDCYGSLRVKGE